MLDNGEARAAIAAFAVTLLTQWVLGPVARRIGFLDHPTERKDHAGATPITGGVAMLLGVMVVGAAMLDSFGPGWRGFTAASLVLVCVGLIDDKYDLSWRVRVPAQIAAALIMVVMGGVYVDQLGPLLGYGTVFLGSLAVPFTVLATVGIINAVNMVDGADGVGGMLVLASLVMFEAAALYVGDSLVAGRVLVLIGAVSAFLAFNLRFPGRHRAKAFMGNAGSGFLGLVIAWVAIRLAEHAPHPVGPVLMVWLVPIPLMDCLVVMLRRLRHGKSPFAADHNHIHHLMLHGGFGPTQIATSLALFSGACGLVAAIAMLAHVPHPVLLIAFIAMCTAWYWATAKRSRAVHWFGWLHRNTWAHLESLAPRRASRGLPQMLPSTETMAGIRGEVGKTVSHAGPVIDRVAGHVMPSRDALATRAQHGRR